MFQRGQYTRRVLLPESVEVLTEGVFSPLIKKLLPLLNKYGIPVPTEEDAWKRLPRAIELDMPGTVFTKDPWLGRFHLQVAAFVGDSGNLHISLKTCDRQGLATGDYATTSTDETRLEPAIKKLAIPTIRDIKHRFSSSTLPDGFGIRQEIGPDGKPVAPAQGAVPVDQATGNLYWVEFDSVRIFGQVNTALPQGWLPQGATAVGSKTGARILAVQVDSPERDLAAFEATIKARMRRIPLSAEKGKTVADAILSVQKHDGFKPTDADVGTASSSQRITNTQLALTLTIKELRDLGVDVPARREDWEDVEDGEFLARIRGTGDRLTIWITVTEQPGSCQVKVEVQDKQAGGVGVVLTVKGTEMFTPEGAVEVVKNHADFPKIRDWAAKFGGLLNGGAPAAAPAPGTALEAVVKDALRSAISELTRVGFAVPGIDGWNASKSGETFRFSHKDPNDPFAYILMHATPSNSQRKQAEVEIKVVYDSGARYADVIKNGFDSGVSDAVRKVDFAELFRRAKDFLDPRSGLIAANAPRKDLRTELAEAIAEELEKAGFACDPNPNRWVQSQLSGGGIELTWNARVNDPDYLSIVLEPTNSFKTSYNVKVSVHQGSNVVAWDSTSTGGPAIARRMAYAALHTNSVKALGANHPLFKQGGSTASSGADPVTTALDLMAKELNAAGFNVAKTVSQSKQWQIIKPTAVATVAEWVEGNARIQIGVQEAGKSFNFGVQLAKHENGKWYVASPEQTTTSVDPQDAKTLNFRKVMADAVTELGANHPIIYIAPSQSTAAPIKPENVFQAVINQLLAAGAFGVPDVVSKWRSDASTLISYPVNDTTPGGPPIGLLTIFVTGASVPYQAILTYTSLPVKKKVADHGPVTVNSLANLTALEVPEFVKKVRLEIGTNNTMFAQPTGQTTSPTSGTVNQRHVAKMDSLKTLVRVLQKAGFKAPSLGSEWIDITMNGGNDYFAYLPNGFATGLAITAYYDTQAQAWTWEAHMVARLAGTYDSDAKVDFTSPNVLRVDAIDAPYLWSMAKVRWPQDHPLLVGAAKRQWPSTVKDGSTDDECDAFQFAIDEMRRAGVNVPDSLDKWEVLHQGKVRQISYTSDHKLRMITDRPDHFKIHYVSPKGDVLDSLSGIDSDWVVAAKKSIGIGIVIGNIAKETQNLQRKSQAAPAAPAGPTWDPAVSQGITDEVMDAFKEIVDDMVRHGVNVPPDLKDWKASGNGQRREVHYTDGTVLTLVIEWTAGMPKPKFVLYITGPGQNTVFKTDNEGDTPWQAAIGLLYPMIYDRVIFPLKGLTPKQTAKTASGSSVTPAGGKAYKWIAEIDESFMDAPKVANAFHNRGWTIIDTSSTLGVGLVEFMCDQGNAANVALLASNALKAAGIPINAMIGLNPANKYVPSAKAAAIIAQNSSSNPLGAARAAQAMKSPELQIEDALRATVAELRKIWPNMPDLPGWKKPKQKQGTLPSETQTRKLAVSSDLNVDLWVLHPSKRSDKSWQINVTIWPPFNPRRSSGSKTIPLAVGKGIDDVVSLAAARAAQTFETDVAAKGVHYMDQFR